MSSTALGQKEFLSFSQSRRGQKGFGELPAVLALLVYQWRCAQQKI